MQLFGFEIKRAEDTKKDLNLDVFSPPVTDDGALVVAAGGVYGTVIDLDGSLKSEFDLVTRYREMSLQPEVEMAIDDIVNEAIITELEEQTIKINLAEVDVPARVKRAIQEEFDYIMKLMDFNNQSYEIFKRWYIDGRLYYHAVIDKTNPNEGIQELRYVDPRKIRKVREVKKRKQSSNIQNSQNKPNTTDTAAEYYVYNEKGFAPANATSGYSPTASTQGLRIAKDSIVHITSGLLDKTNSLVLSYLHKAIKPLNNLRALEDAAVIYRISRAPERRIFYIDVGNLPKMKAEQYLKDMMTRHKNKIVYDASTGELRDDRKFMTMLEDYWLPRREGNRGTEITTLPAGQNLGQMGDIEYFQEKLYKSLNVPISRMQQDAAYSMGRATEISRDEVKFAKFVDRLRLKFSQLFLKTLEKQLVLKSIMTMDEWKDISSRIKVVYSSDNLFAELKDIEITKERMGVLQILTESGVVGKYFSNRWVRTNVLKQTEEEMERMDNEVREEASNPLYAQPSEEEQQQPPANQ
jgi:hypothetical protein